MPYINQNKNIFWNNIMPQLKSGIFMSGIILSIYFGLHQYISTIRWISLGLSDRVLIVLALCLLVSIFGAALSYVLHSWFKQSKNMIILCCLALFVVSLSPLRQLRGPDGDAPHYLAAARYFAMTGTFENVDAYHGREHVKFFLPYAEIWELPDRRLSNNVDGKQQFFYSVLLPVIAAPFSLYKPEMTFFLIHALLIYLGLFMIWKLPGSILTGWHKAILMACSPVVFFTAQPYPDSLAFFLVSAGLWAVLQRKLVLLGLVCALLIWAKPPYVVITAFLMTQAVFSYHLWNRSYRSELILLCLLPFCSYLGLSTYNLYSWGSFNITANYGNVGTHISLNHLDMLPRFFFSFAGGIFWIWPFFIHLCSGKILDQIIKKREWIFLFIGSLGYVFLVGINSGESGWAPRGRYFLPVLPIFLFLIQSQVKKLHPLLIILATSSAFICTIMPQGVLPWGDLNAPFSILTYSQVLNEWSGIPFKGALYTQMAKHISIISWIGFILMLGFSIVSFSRNTRLFRTNRRLSNTLKKSEIS